MDLSTSQNSLTTLQSISARIGQRMSWKAGDSVLNLVLSTPRLPFCLYSMCGRTRAMLRSSSWVWRLSRMLMGSKISKLQSQDDDDPLDEFGQQGLPRDFSAWIKTFYAFLLVPDAYLQLPASI